MSEKTVKELLHVLETRWVACPECGNVCVMGLNKSGNMVKITCVFCDAWCEVPSEVILKASKKEETRPTN